MKKKQVKWKSHTPGTVLAIVLAIEYHCTTEDITFHYRVYNLWSLCCIPSPGENRHAVILLRQQAEHVSQEIHDHILKKMMYMYWCWQSICTVLMCAHVMTHKWPWRARGIPSCAGRSVQSALNKWVKSVTLHLGLMSGVISEIRQTRCASLSGSSYSKLSETWFTSPESWYTYFNCNKNVLGVLSINKN